jgi:hypothetical protein
MSPGRAGGRDLVARFVKRHTGVEEEMFWASRDPYGRGVDAVRGDPAGADRAEGWLHGHASAAHPLDSCSRRLRSFLLPTEARGREEVYSPRLRRLACEAEGVSPEARVFGFPIRGSFRSNCPVLRSRPEPRTCRSTMCPWTREACPWLLRTGKKERKAASSDSCRRMPRTWVKPPMK